MKFDKDIKTPADVARFFFWLVFEVGVDFNPDDSFFDYENYKTKQPTFSEENAIYYDCLMVLCHEVCVEYDRDIYQMAARVLGLYHYCDHNDIMAQICDDMSAINPD